MKKNQERQRKESRNEKARRETRVKEHMKLPVNKFLNSRDKEGKFLYPIAEKLGIYFINNPDPILNDMRILNANVHNIRHYGIQAKKCLKQYESNEPITIVGNTGRIMTKEEVYSEYIVNFHSTYTELSRIRENIVNKLLPKVDGELMTFQQFNDYILKLEEIIKDLGYTLFPDKVEVIEPK